MSPMIDPDTHRWHAAGLFLVTFATLLLEVLNTRLLSVITWYHLSFLAVSLAMLGMAGGAVQVFLGRREFDQDRVRNTLARRTLVLAAFIPISHLAMLVVPMPDVRTLQPTSLILVMIGMIVVLGMPFLVSGVVVTLALTRAGNRSADSTLYLICLAHRPAASR